MSIFVLDDYRRQGIATVLASHLLKWCLDNHMEANWDAVNPESCQLAEKLGYAPTANIRPIICSQSSRETMI